MKKTVEIAKVMKKAGKDTSRPIRQFLPAVCCDVSVSDHAQMLCYARGKFGPYARQLFYSFRGCNGEL